MLNVENLVKGNFFIHSITTLRTGKVVIIIIGVSFLGGGGGRGVI